MEVRGIELTNFRSFGGDFCAFSRGVNIIMGKNAAGKTNLLEAVYVLTCGKSFRTRFDRELIAFGKETAKVKAVAETRGREIVIEADFAAGRKKRLSVGGAVKTREELGSYLSAVIFCPDDLGMVKDGAASRRRFLDLAISQLRPNYTGILSEFNRLYAHKTKILTLGREKPSLYDTLDDFSDKLFRVSAQIIRYRASFLQRLSAEAVAIHSNFSGGRETLGIEYVTVADSPLAAEREIYDRLMEHYNAHKKAEINSCQCITGPHRDDVEFSIDGKASRTFASQGQARTTALSVKLAERELHFMETGEYPLLLLDDVLSELDAGRREFLLERIDGGQTLITCCDGDILSQHGGIITADVPARTYSRVEIYREADGITCGGSQPEVSRVRTFEGE